MLKKIYDNRDILYYFSEYLTFDEKLVLQNIFTEINLIKNYNFYDKRNNKKTLFTLNCICDDCFIDLSSDQSSHLSSLYEFFLYNSTSDNESDSTSETDSNIDPTQYCFTINPYQNIYDSCRIRDENEFILSTYYYIATRAFIEVLDKNNIKMDIFKIDCLFELDLDNNIFDQIYNKIDEIYIDGIEDKRLHLFCKKCGVFGHSHQSKNCVLFNKSYEKYIVKREVDTLMNDLIKNVIDKDKEEKRQEERLKKLCCSCKHNFFSTKCEKKMCKNCCNCNAHKKVKNKNKTEK
jgi:hypothetical protein